MQLLRRFVCLAIGGAFGLIHFSALSQPTVAGFTPGSFRVTESGAAEYRIPIRVPPGIAGMEPKLALVYSSHSGNGLLGMGWNLEGLSAITRCPRTMAQDGVRGGVNYDWNDRYCMDGQRLIAISGSYGTDGTEYRTERESFTKVISYGTAGNGPAWFKAWTKSGQIFEYGNTADSRIEAQGKTSVRIWAVNKISDTKGNYVTVSYAEDALNGDFRPERIDYTGNTSGLAPSRSVRFTVQPRLDVTPAYISGSVIQTPNVLTNVKTYLGETLVKDYQFYYQYSGSTQRARLATMTECDASITTCLPAVTLSWPSVTEGGYVVPPAFNLNGYWLQHGNRSYQTHLGDFNGDGKTDVLRTSDDMAQNALFLSNGDGSFTVAGGFNLSSYWLTHSNRTYQVHLGDFNRDGKTDILRSSDDPGQNALFLSNGDGTFNVLGAPFNLVGYWLTHSNFTYQIHLGDFNGDGRVDVLRSSDDPGQNTLFLSNGDGSFVIHAGFNLAGAWLTHSNRTYQVHLGDFNGDGRTDILRSSDDTGQNALFLAHPDGSGSFSVAAAFNLVGAWLTHSNATYGLLLGDFNGDGWVDVLRYCDDFNQNVLYFSRADGSFAFAPAFNLYTYLFHSSKTWGSLLGDFNGDGKTDIVQWQDDFAWNRLYLSKGDGSFAIPTFSITNDWIGTSVDTLGALAGDFNGDGRSDLIRWSNTFAYNALWWSTTPGIADLAGSIGNGTQLVASFTYQPLTDSSVYAKDTGAFAASDPQVDLQIPLYVASAASANNGLGGSATTNYKYGGLKSSYDGRGSLGFRWSESTQQSTGLKVRTENRQDWPYVGLPSLVKRTQSSGAVLSDATSPYGCTNPATGGACTVAAGNRYFPFASQSVETGNDLNGAALPTVTTITQYDGFGNPTSITVSTGDGYSKATTSTYLNDAVNWLLGRLTRSTVQSTSP